MKDCAYYKCKHVDGIVHEFCTNEELNQINESNSSENNSSNVKYICCFGSFANCGKYEKITTTEKGECL